MLSDNSFVEMLYHEGNEKELVSTGRSNDSLNVKCEAK